MLFKSGDPDRDDLYIPPYLFDLDQCPQDDALMDDEIFGPLLPIRSIDSMSEALEFLNGKEKPLAMYLFTRNEKAVQEFMSRTRSGAVTVNDVVLHINGKSFESGN